MNKKWFSLFCSIIIFIFPATGLILAQEKTAPQSRDSLEIEYAKALELADQGKIEKAVTFLAEVLAKYKGPKNDSYYAVKLHLAAAYMRLGKKEEAEKIWESISSETKHVGYEK